MPSMGSFSEPGDSGLFVFNNIREVAGLLYGELTGNIMLGETTSEADSNHFTENTVVARTLE